MRATGALRAGTVYVNGWDLTDPAAPVRWIQPVRLRPRSGPRQPRRLPGDQIRLESFTADQPAPQSDIRRATNEHLSRRPDCPPRPVPDPGARPRRAGPGRGHAPRSPPPGCATRICTCLDGDLDVRYPMVGGPEAAGIVETDRAGGDEGGCGRPCRVQLHPELRDLPLLSTGRQNLATRARPSSRAACPTARSGCTTTGTDYSAFCMLGAFSEYATVSQLSVVKVDDWLPLRERRTRRLRGADRMGHRRQRRRRPAR